MNTKTLFLKLLTGAVEQIWMDYTGVEVTPEEYEFLRNFHGHLNKIYTVDGNTEFKYTVDKPFDQPLIQKDGKYYVSLYEDPQDRIVQVADYFDAFRTYALFQAKGKEE